MATEELSILGHRVEGSIEAEQMEVIPVSDRISRITFETAELAAMCPVTNQPDLYHASIFYAPKGLGLESKSLKLYLHRWRNIGIFGEDLASTIADDIQAKVQALYTVVVLKQQRRGGLEMEVRAGVGELFGEDQEGAS